MSSDTLNVGTIHTMTEGRRISRRVITNDRQDRKVPAREHGIQMRLVAGKMTDLNIMDFRAGF